MGTLKVFLNINFKKVFCCALLKLHFASKCGFVAITNRNFRRGRIHLVRSIAFVQWYSTSTYQEKVSDLMQRTIGVAK